MKNPLISVIIPVYNEEKDIGKCLSSLMQQTYKNIEIIVIDDGSTDSTRDIVNKFRKVRLIKGRHKGPGFSRNLGAKISKGKILSFVDADMTFDRDYLKKLAEPILQGRAIGTEERTQLSTNMDNIWSRCWGSRVRSYPKKVKEGNIFRAIMKSEFTRMGGFDPKYGYADDMTFFFKYGVKSSLVDDAGCFHKNPEKLNEVYKQSRWIGASLRNPLINTPILKYSVPIAMVLLSPIAILYASIKKTIQNRNFKLFLPWMFIFMTVRYFGLISGIYRKVYQNKNVR